MPTTASPQRDASVVTEDMLTVQVARLPRSAVIGPVLLALGQLLLPPVGWIIGLLVIAFSPTWRRVEKIVLLALAPAVAFAGGAIAVLTTSAPKLPDVAEQNGFVGPTNPFADRAIAIFEFGVIPFILVNVCAAVILALLAMRKYRRPSF